VWAGSVQLSLAPKSHSGNGDPAASAAVLETIQGLALDGGCILGARPEASPFRRDLPFDYFLSAGKLPNKPMPGAECMEFSPDALAVAPPPGQPDHPMRAVFAGETPITPDYGPQDAENARALLQWRGATVLCSVTAQTGKVFCIKAPCPQPRGPIVRCMVSGGG
jgi:hypothetical protein